MPNDRMYKDATFVTQSLGGCAHASSGRLTVLAAAVAASCASQFPSGSGAVAPFDGSGSPPSHATSSATSSTTGDGYYESTPEATTTTEVLLLCCWPLCFP